MSFKDNSYMELRQAFFQGSKTICAFLVEGVQRNNSVSYFVFGPVVMEMSFKRYSYLELWLLFCSAEVNHLCNFGRA